jgi:hypothetical protein
LRGRLWPATSAIDTLSCQLLQEIRGRTDVLTADLVTRGPGPQGAKSADLIETGKLVLQTLAPALPGLVGLLRGWSDRHRSGNVTVILTIEDRSVHLEYPVGSMTQDDLMKMIAIVVNAPPDPGSAPAEGTASS